MPKNFSLDEIKKFWPEKAPDINMFKNMYQNMKKKKLLLNMEETF